MSTTGNRLKNIRKTLNLSQEEFGRKIGLSRGGIAAVEADNNKFSQDILCKLIQTFNVNINYLLCNIGQPFISPKFEDAKDEILKEVDEILKKYGVIEK